MQVEAISSTGTPLQQQPKASESVEAGRKKMESGQADLDKSSTSQESEVQPEEILSQIKALTEDGVYSVRFENSQEFNELVVKVVNTETDEVIRQVPAEEILGMKASLAELRGHIVNTAR